MIFSDNAPALEAGLDRGYLSKVENSLRNPKPDMLVNIAKAYHVDYDYLMELCGYKDEEPIIYTQIKKRH